MPALQSCESSSSSSAQRWALVLAGGEGSRLQSLTTMDSGLAVPKQFCSFGGGDSLLHDALTRATAVVAPERACVVVAEHHARWWQSLANTVVPENIVVQPRSRGTAIGILLPLLLMLNRDAEASVLVLPSDHLVKNESVLAARLREAAAEAERRHDRILLLGFAPDEADPELGYILPAAPRGPTVRAVSQFVEKPSSASALELIQHGALWNSFIFAARGQTLLRTFETCCPEVVKPMRGIVVSHTEPAARQQELRLLYEQLPSLDFSRDILQKSLDRLEVATVPACGWSDLGTPRRVAEAVVRYGPVPHARRGALDASSGPLDLATQMLRSRSEFGLRERPQ